MLVLPKLLIPLLLVGTKAATSRLRASKNLVRQLDSYDSVNLCFCEGCNSQTQNTPAGGHSCGERIEWLQSNQGHSEIHACRIVAGTEYPDECGACDPDSCQVQSFCEVPTCTVEVLETPACNDSMGGCHQCGERIRYLMDSQGYTTADACERVSQQQFPEECGLCGTPAAPSARSPTLEPSPSPSATPSGVPTITPSESPSIQPSMVPTSLFAVYDGTTPTNNVCGTPSCTREVLDTMACNDNLGGCYTCGARIDHLIQDEFYAPADACEIVGYSQFMSSCGGCMPDHLRTPGTKVLPTTCTSGAVQHEHTNMRMKLDF
jgi:hypothetical protein